MPARSVTSDAARVMEEANAPITAVTLFWEMRRWVAAAAVFGVGTSAVTSLILAPPRALMPPAALMVSAASSMPRREPMPNWALGPLSGWITPMSTSSAAAAAWAMPAARIPAPMSAARAPRRL